MRAAENQVTDRHILLGKTSMNDKWLQIEYTTNIGSLQFAESTGTKRQDGEPLVPKLIQLLSTLETPVPSLLLSELAESESASGSPS